MTGFPEFHKFKPVISSLLKTAVADCCTWSFDFVRALEDEPVITRSNETHFPHDLIWWVEVRPLQKWVECDVHVIQVTIDIFGSGLHFGTVQEFYDDNRALVPNDLYEYLKGVPEKLREDV